MREPALNVRGLSKRFGATRALDGVSFELARGTVHALLGSNGCGKSTLIKILAGVQAADGGEVAAGGRVFDATAITPGDARDAGLRFVHQQQSTCAELSVAENLALGHGFVTGAGGRVRWRAQREHAERVLKRFRIDAAPDQALGSLPAAKQTMVAIARALQDLDEETRGVLVLDEPTAALPAGEVELLLSALRGYAERGETILYVSHRLEEVTAVADAATVLRDGRVGARLRRDELTHDRLVRAIVGRELAAFRPASPAPAQHRRPVLQARGLAGRAVRDASFELHAGEIVGIAGLLGSGRTTLLQLLFGVVERTSGTIELDGRPVRFRHTRDAIESGIAYLPEDRTQLAMFPDMSVQENLGMAVTRHYFRRGRLQRRREQCDAEALVRAYGVRTASLKAPLSALSGGNQQKVVLARWMRREPRVLLLDEPTQGVDVGARADIYALIDRAAQAGTAVLLASSDEEELVHLSHRVLVLRGGAIAAELRAGEIDEENLNHALLHEEASPR